MVTLLIESVTHYHQLGATVQERDHIREIVELAAQMAAESGYTGGHSRKSAESFTTAARKQLNH